MKDEKIGISWKEIPAHSRSLKELLYNNDMQKTSLYIACGIPFSGKSYLSQKLVNKFNFSRIDLDEIKFELFGKNVKDQDIDQAGWDKIYQEMYRKIEKNLKLGKIVLNDTGNFTKHERDLVRQVANKLGLKTRVIYVDTPISIARERQQNNRNTNSRFDVTDDDFESTIKEMEPPAADESPIIYHYPENLDNWISNNFK